MAEHEEADIAPLSNSNHAPGENAPWWFQIRTDHLWRAVPFLIVAWISSLAFLPALDFWWHLKSGQIILESGSIPTTDLFSYTASGKPYILQNWLAEILFYVVYRAGGPALVIFINSLLLIGALIPIHCLCLKRAPSVRAAVIASSLAATSLACQGNIRPQVFSVLLFAWFYYVLAEYFEGRRNLLWLLPVMMVLWVNLHGAFVLGICLFALIASLSLFGSSFKEVTGPDSKRWLKVMLILALTLGATLCSPQLARIYSYVAEVAHDPISQRHVIEWQPPQVKDIGDILRFFGVFLLGIVILVRSKVKPSFRDLALFLVLAVFAFTAKRNAVWFALVAAPILAAYIPIGASSSGRLKPGLTRFLNLSIAALWLITTVVSLPWCQQLRSTRDRDLLFLDPRLPVRAMDFIQTTHLKGRIFHPQHYGDYLIWRLWPAQRTFFDGRVHLFPSEIAEDYLNVVHGNAAWEEVMQRHQVQFLLLDRKEQDQQRLLKAVGKGAGWELLYKDERSMLYKRVSQLSVSKAS